jgi:hypothetical protein
MWQKPILFIILTLMIFLIWAAFALLIVNACCEDTLPGYVIGHICVWDYTALAVSGLLAYGMIRSWGPVLLISEDRKKQIALDIRYLYFFIAYFIFGIAIAIWQFYVFSLNF